MNPELSGKRAMVLGGSRGFVRKAITFVASPAALGIDATHIVANGGQVASVDQGAEPEMFTRNVD